MSRTVSLGCVNNGAATMIDAVVLDTGFLISLVDRSRPCHAAAKAYYRYFLEHGITMFSPTVVAAEFALKQPVTDLPLRNFRVLPFTLNDAVRCAALNVAQYRGPQGHGQRDAVKDDFKIIAQAEEQNARLLITEDASTLPLYCARLTTDGKVRIVQLRDGFDQAMVNQDGQRQLGLGST